MAMTVPDYPRIGAAIRQFRLERHLAQKQLAALAGTSSTILSLVERDRHVPALRTVYACAAAMGCRISDLFVRAESLPPVPCPHMPASRNVHNRPH